MQAIKFRGETNNGDLMYGNLKIDNREAYIFDGKRLAYVKPESVKQLVYIDGTGKEYYEGDVMTKDGRRWQVSLRMHWTEVNGS